MRRACIAFILICLFAPNAAPAAASSAEPRGSVNASAIFQNATAPAVAAKGVLEGVVTDASGAAVVGATVTVHDGAGAVKTASTDNSGKFHIDGLAAGAQDVTITQSTFADYKGEGVTVDPGETQTLIVQLQPLVKATDVLVQSERASGIQTDNGVVSTTLNEARVQAIPLNGRVFLGLLTIAPGVSNQTGQDEAKVGVVGSAKFAVNGGRTEYNSFLVDSSDVLNTDVAASHGQSSLMVYPSIDSIKELKVLTSNYGAEYGRSASGTVLVTTRSGLSKIHGSGYEFIRNEFFNARNYFDVQPKAPLYRRNDFGGTIGGPIVIPHFFNTSKDKSFFFISEEFRKEKSPQQFNHGVPSDAERGYNTLTHSYGPIADFSDVCPSFAGGLGNVDPSTYPDCPTKSGTQGYEFNQFAINPASATFLTTGLIPRANSTTGCTSSIGSCYNQTVSPPTGYREDLIRLDQALPLRTNLSLTVIHDHWTAVVPIPQWPNNINSFPTVENQFVGPGFSAVGHLTTLLPHSFLNDISYGFTRQRITLADIAGPGASLSSAGLGALGAPLGSIFAYSGGKIPGLVIAGTNAAYGGAGFNADTSYEPWSHFLSTQTYRESITMFAGKHTLLLGVQFVHALRNETSAANGANTGDRQGVLRFGSSSNSGNAFADFLTGTINNYQQDNTQLPYRVTYWTTEPYLQDDWKVTPRLTLNLGLRMSLFYNWMPERRPLYNWVPGAFNPKLLAAANVIVNPNQGYYQNAGQNGQGSPIPPSPGGLYPYQTNGLIQCGTNGVDASCQTTHLVNPAPRLGMAWDPTGRGTTSIRAGYGVFFEHGTGSEANAGSLIGNPPQILSVQQSFPASYQDIGHAGLGRTEPLSFPLNMVSIPARTVWPYVQQWSFGVQQEITRDTAVGLSYVGSKGTHLATQFQTNQLPPVSAADNPFGANQPVTRDICHALPGSHPVYFGRPPVALDPVKDSSAYLALNVACNGTPADPVNGIFTPIQVDLNSVRPLQGIGSVQAIRDVASSVYHSAQLTMRSTHGPMDVQLSYTFSHSIDSASDRYESTFVDSYDLAANRASSAFDQRQLFNLSYVYQLPLLRLIQNLRNGVACTPSIVAEGDSNCPASLVAPPYGGPSKWTKLLASSWSLSGITLFTTGTPFSVVNGGSSNGGVEDNAGLALGDGADSYADVAHGGPPCTKATTTSSGTFGPLLGNPCQFVAPRGLTQGNSGRNYYRNPRRTNFDLAALKEFKTWHESTVQFRAESFNIFNNTQFIVYDPNKGNTGSNTVSCYGDSFNNYSAGAYNCQSGNALFRPVEAHRPRTLQFGLKLEF